jgi:hypothetical protein
MNSRIKPTTGPSGIKYNIGVMRCEMKGVFRISSPQSKYLNILSEEPTFKERGDNE